MAECLWQTKRIIIREKRMITYIFEFRMLSMMIELTIIVHLNGYL